VKLERGEQMAYKARMFNKQAADSKNKPKEILKALALQQGEKIADLGAGGGYYSLEFAEAVGRQGVIYALDTDPDKIEFIQRSAAERGLSNVQAVLVEEKNVTLPEKVDLIFLRNVYHHISNRVEYFAKLKESLKPNGRIAIVEHNSSGRLSLHEIFEHRVAKENIIEEMITAGYCIEESLDFLPKQSFTIFRLKE